MDFTSTLSFGTGAAGSGDGAPACRRTRFARGRTTRWPPAVADSAARTGRLLHDRHGRFALCQPHRRAAATGASGIEAWATSAAELLQAPLPNVEDTRIARLAIRRVRRDRGTARSDCTVPKIAFGMTLDPASALGRALPCLVGAGGGEVAFAATRSADGDAGAARRLLLAALAATMTMRRLHCASLQGRRSTAAVASARSEIRDRGQRLRRVPRPGGDLRADADGAGADAGLRFRARASSATARWSCFRPKSASCFCAAPRPKSSRRWLGARA